MPQFPPDLDKILRSLDKRIDKLEAVTWFYGDPGEGDPLTITGLIGNVVYIGDPIIGLLAAYIDVSWNPIPSDPDDGDYDPPTYRIKWQVGTGEFTPETVTDDTLIRIGPFPLDTDITIEVRAKTRGDRAGPPSGILVNTGNDTTPPPQPSTPTATGMPGGIQVAWDGEDHTGAPMPADFARAEVHVSTSPAFLPSDATHMGDLFVAGQTTILTGDSTAVHYIKLVAVDLLGNRSVSSTEVSATPEAFDPGSGSIGYEELEFDDLNDLIPDGSFEKESNRQRILDEPMTDPSWSFTNAGSIFNGAWAALHDNTIGTGNRFLTLVANGVVRVRDNRSVWSRIAVWVDSNVASRGSISIRLVWTRVDGTTVTQDIEIAATALTSATWTALADFKAAPNNAVRLGIRVRVNGSATAGSWRVDACECRWRMGRVMMEEAVIGEAQIEDLQVKDAKIQNLTVSKLTAGTLSADVIVSARIKTADTGQRVEINGSGIQAFNGSGVQTFSLATSGTLTVTTAFVIRTAASGSRFQFDSSGFAGFAGATQTLLMDAATGNILLVGRLTSTTEDGKHVDIFGDRIMFEEDTGKWGPADELPAHITTGPGVHNFGDDDALILRGRRSDAASNTGLVIDDGGAAVMGDGVTHDYGPFGCRVINNIESMVNSAGGILVQFGGSSIAPTIGFLDTPPVTQRNSGGTLAGVIAGLVDLGLFNS